jgi:glyoxylase-like metal-dependent hydrolase (beta-lactamase superfamily II)
MPLGPNWTIGDVTVTSIIEIDQHWRFAWLLPEVTEADVDQIEWLRPHFIDEKGKMILRIQALVVESQGQRIVVDTCVGNEKDRPTPLFDKLQTTFFDDLVAAGFGPDTIDQVVCTHMHVDHVGWNTRLVDGAWVPTFPRSRYLFGRIEYDHWAATDETSVYGDVMGDSVAPVVDAGLAIFVESDHHLTDEVFLEPTPGHTPGHHSIRISSAGQEAVITGDMVHHPIQFPRPDLASGADTDSPAAIATRRSSFDRWATSGLLVIGTHFAGPGAGRLKSEAGCWRLEV